MNFGTSRCLRFASLTLCLPTAPVICLTAGSLGPPSGRLSRLLGLDMVAVAADQATSVSCCESDERPGSASAKRGKLLKVAGVTPEGDAFDLSEQTFVLSSI